MSAPLRTARIVACRAALAALCGLMFWAVMPLFLGGHSWDARAIVSGSMAPHIHRGDVVATSHVDRVEPGQVITFQPHDGGYRTHRVTEVSHDGRITTKGDANPTPDYGTIGEHRVVGVGRFRVPFVGYPICWAAEHRWALVSGTFTGLLLLALGCRETPRHHRPAAAM